MTDLKKHSDSQLLQNIQVLAAEERKITAAVLAHLEEIDRRKLHLERGFSSLFTFCQEALGYSSDQAMRRISAMRITREVPEARDKIEQGVLSLTNVSKVQSFLNAEKKSGHSYTPDKKRELLEQMEGLSTRECEQALAAISPELPKPDRERPVQRNQTQITFTADDELMEDLRKIRALIAHQDPQASYGDLFKKMARVMLAKIDPQSKKSVVAPKATEGKTRYIPESVRASVWKRDDGKCQYVDPQTHRVCQSDFMLELDHAVPFAWGGLSTELNLRLRCAGHNDLHARQVSGSRNFK